MPTCGGARCVFNQDTTAKLYPQLLGQKSAIRPGSIFNRQGGSVFNQRQHRIQPFWQHVWPKFRDLASPSIAESLVRLSTAAGSEFPVALTAVQDWLHSIEHPHYVVRRLLESKLCSRFPLDALRLLNVIIDDLPWAPRELGQCLDAIVQATPDLTQDARYHRLFEYSRRRGV